MSENPTRQVAADHEYVKLVVGARNDEVASMEEARGVIAENLKPYAFLLPLHIGREDAVLFPLADTALDEDDPALLAEKFARVKAEEGSAAARERYHAMAQALATLPAGRETARG